MSTLIPRVSLILVLVGFGLTFRAQSASRRQTHVMCVVSEDGAIPLTGGEPKYFTVPFGRTIQARDMTGPAAGRSARIDLSNEVPKTAYATASASIVIPLIEPCLLGSLPTYSRQQVVGSETQARLVLQCP